MNSNRPLDPYLIPTRVVLQLPDGWSADAPAFPPDTKARFSFSDEPVAVFEGSFTVTVLVHRAANAGPLAVLTGSVEAQACNDSMCIAPAEASFSVPADGPAAAIQALEPARSVTPDAGAQAAIVDDGGSAIAPLKELGGPPPPPSGLSSGFVHGGLLLQLAIVFIIGLGLNLTPCVYPLIPITVGFFLSQKEQGAKRTWLLAVFYVLGMSVTYSSLGVAAALTGRLFGAALQSPWVIGLIVAVLLALAASMFGAWEIRVPSWATRASGGRAGAGGALLMGLVVGLVAAPCIGPLVIGLLTYVGERQDVVLGFSMFFALSLGLGMPYLFLAVFTGALDRLPNSGAWMLGVRQVFGVLLIALAGYFVRPLLPSPLNDQLLAAILVLGGLYLLLVARPGHEQPAVDRVMRMLSAGVLVAGVVLFPRPATHTTVELAWRPFDEASLNQALAGGKPVVLDFYATWCAPCKELDEKTFSDPRVAAELARFERFKVDLTRSDARTDAVRRRFDVMGVPTLAFFVHGSEITALRLTGFEPPPVFVKRLRRIGAD